jgi:hypothetical protein
MVQAGRASSGPAEEFFPSACAARYGRSSLVARPWTAPHRGPRPRL